MFSMGLEELRIIIGKATMVSANGFVFIYSCLVGSDSQNSFSVYGQEVTVISSQASGSQQPSPGSNKVV